jgi:hypothetical protein
MLAKKDYDELLELLKDVLDSWQYGESIVEASSLYNRASSLVEKRSKTHDDELLDLSKDVLDSWQYGESIVEASSLYNRAVYFLEKSGM